MGRTVLITGTNRGIGKATVERFAKEADITIIVHARKASEGFETWLSTLGNETGTRLVPVYFDLAKPEEVSERLGQILKEHKTIDALVNNAGILATPKSFLMTPLEDFHKVFDVNFFAVVQVTQIVAKAMIRNRRGAIVNLSSIAAFSGIEGQSEYSSSKAAVIGLTKRLAHELAPYRIRCNAVAPSMTDTDMISNMADSMKDELLKKHLAGRVATREEIANTIYWLASDESSYINGQCLKVDGGGYKIDG